MISVSAANMAMTMAKSIASTFQIFLILPVNFAFPIPFPPAPVAHLGKPVLRLTARTNVLCILLIFFVFTATHSFFYTLENLKSDKNLTAKFFISCILSSSKFAKGS